MSEDQMTSVECTEITEVISSEDPIIHLTENGVVGFEVLCRLCANRSDHLIPIYSEEGISNDLADKMNLYLPVKVTKNDLLPLQCCFQCASTVLTWHELVIASIEADKRLRDVQAEVEKQLAEQNADIEAESEAGPSQQEHEKIFIQEDDGCSELSCTLLNKQGNKKKQRRKKKNEYECEICSRRFIRTSSLQQHISNHSEDNYCDACCNSFISKYHLNLHKLTHTEEELQLQPHKNVECPYSNCNENFPSKLQLYEHKKIHENIIDYTCKSCPKKFATSSQLDAHIKYQHTLCVCSFCGKQYANEKTLRTHTSTLHSKNDGVMYSCNYCDLKFRNASRLKTHEIYHTGKKKHKCVQCDKSFARSDYLKEHIRIHNNEKPFTCEFCDKSFRQKNVLTTHLSKNHRSCTICKEIVGGALKLRMHIWKNHSQDNPQTKTSII